MDGRLPIGSEDVRGFLGNEGGQVVVLTALSLMLLMGVMALAVDVGHLHYLKQQLDSTADAAALAGALEISACGGTANCTAMQEAAKSAVAENGFSAPSLATQCAASSGTGVALQLNNGPCALGSSDPNHGNTNYVEAVLTETQGTFFGAVIGVPAVKLVSRSEATVFATGSGGSGNACLYAGSVAFNSSNGVMDLQCGIQDNGNLQTNNGDSVNTPSFTYAGSWSPNNCNGSCVWSKASPTSGSKANDPLASKTPPIQPAISSTNTQTPNNGATLQPGYYPWGFNLNSNVSVTLSPGVYYLGGSINVDSGATLSGTGVTMYFASGSLQPNSGSTVQIVAPTTGANAGMLVWDAGSNSTTMNMDASSASYFQGIIYLPSTNAGFTMNSGSGVTVNGGAAYTIVDIGGQLMMNSSETFVIKNDYSSLPGGNPLGGGGALSAVLAE
jgi:Flp pilus assembly protein TadG